MTLRPVATKVYDQTLSHLSYQTDNGAQYCFCNKDCDLALLKVRADGPFYFILSYAIATLYTSETDSAIQHTS